MKIINNKSILLSLALSSSLFASTYEYPQLYKDTKIMGMGGANIAVGGQATSLFYNTAGIADIPKEYGWEVDILNMNFTASQNIQDFMDDMDDANDDSKTDSQKTSDTLDVTEDYLGKNLHISANIGIASVAKKFDEYAFSIVPIAGFYTNIKTHRGSGSEGILETQGLVYSGFALGVSKDMPDQNFLGYDIKQISLGVGLKSLQYKSIYANLSVSELIDDDLSDYFEDKYTKDGSSTVLDLGAKAEVYPDVTAGVSIQNIGSIASEIKTNEIPTTVSLGVAYKHRFNRTYFNQYQVAFDYIDLFQAYSQDNDFIKRTRLGISGNAFDGWGGTLALQAGLYEGHPTYGIDFRATVVKLSYTTYTEEVGAYSGQDKDTRHMFQLSFGW
jgi:hypothetical protein